MLCELKCLLILCIVYGGTIVGLQVVMSRIFDNDILKLQRINKCRGQSY